MVAARRLATSSAILIAVPPLVGGLFAYLAYVQSPLTLPAALLAVAAIAASVSHRGVAIGVAVLLIPMGSIASRVYGVVEWQPYVPIVIWSALLLGGTLLAAWGAGWRRPPLALAAASYAAVSLVALLVGGDIVAAQQPLRFVLVGSVLFFGTAMLVREREDVPWVLRALALAVLAVGGVAIVQKLSGGSGGAFVTASGQLVDRASGGFSHPNVLGGYLAFLAPLLIAGALVDRPWRAGYLLAIAIAVLAVYMSFSRGALVGLALAPLFFLPLRRVVWLFPAVAILFVLLAPDLLRERFTTLAGDGSELATRLDFWRVSLSIWSENPVLGAGLGSFPDAYAVADVPGRGFLPSTILEPPPHAHNLFLNHLAEVGIVGLAAIVALLFSALRHAISVRRTEDPWLRAVASGVLGSLVVFVVHNQFEVMMFGELGETFWIMVGLASALGSILLRERRGDASGELRT